MTIQIKVPSLPESVADATVATWHKKAGDAVKKDETLVELETDKVILEVPATATGILAAIAKPQGSIVLADDVLGTITEGAAVAQPAPVQAATTVAAAAKPAADASPAVRQLITANELNPADLTGSGKGGKILKEDVEKALAGVPSAPATTTTVSVTGAGQRSEKREPMTRMRARIAERLLAVKSQTAMLTTFNEVNMKAVMDLRAQYKDKFQQEHNAKLGFMSFFTKACVEALKLFPAVNASIDGNDIVYHGYYDIGIAVSSERGLVVPVLRNAENMSLADMEKSIADYAGKARAGKLTLEEMTGGTFTITNGGTFGSMLSTPILNSPQSAILGMHNIVERPVAEKGQVVIRPIMYLALSYDHRIIDGKDSVSFLRTVKEFLEDPARMLLGV